MAVPSRDLRSNGMERQCNEHLCNGIASQNMTKQRQCHAPWRGAKQWQG